MRHLSLIVALGTASLLLACRGNGDMPEPPPHRGNVVDVDRFAAFIGTQPTPERFRQEYPNVTLVLPGDIATRELRLDRSRYFAELDAKGRIVGGRFQ